MVARALSAWSPGRRRLRWEPVDDGFTSRRRRVPFEYDATLPPSIAGLDAPIAAGSASVIEQAAVAVTRLQSVAAVVGDLEPLLRLEAMASSRIEGIEVSQRRMGEALAGLPSPQRSAVQAAANVRVMRAAVGEAVEQPIGRATLLALHRTLLEAADPAIAGRLRERQNWVGTGPTPRDAVYVPPPPELVAPLLDDLGAWCERTDLSVIVQAAVAHAQFEGIHPFVDGNGRTGRALIHVVLRRRGLAPRVSPPVSAVLVSRKDAYLAALAAAQQEGDHAPWIRLFCEATVVSCGAVASLSEELADLSDRWAEAAGRPGPTSVLSRLLAMLPRYPVLITGAVAAALGVDDGSARRAVAQVVAAGIGVEASTKAKGRRAVIVPSVLDALEAFEHELAP